MNMNENRISKNFTSEVILQELNNELLINLNCMPRW